MVLLSRTSLGTRKLVVLLLHFNNPRFPSMLCGLSQLSVIGRDIVKFQERVAHPGQWETTIVGPDQIWVN